MRPLPILFVLILALAVFGGWMHPAVLDPGNVGWLLDGNDRGASAIGTAAYLRAGSWPLLRQPLLSYPQGLSLLFTDSVPLIGWLLHPFAGGAMRQFVGIWYLACVVLQAAFAWALVGRHARDPLVRWLGAALLTFVPVLLNRYGHPSLCAQWLILWALWVHVDADRSRHTGWWLAVLATAAMIHSYLLVMVAAVWGATLLRRWVGEGARVAWQVPVVLAPVAAILAMHGIIGERFVSTHSYGSWPAALDAWWNPANPSYARLLPSSPDRGDALGFEGLQYLGAGLLALVAVAVVLRVRAREWSAEDRRLAWLAPGFVVLALVAIGPAPLWRGLPLFRVPVPGGLVDLLDPVRAGGRLVWPVTYVLIYLAVSTAARQGRAVLLLGGAQALQVIDLSGMAAAIRATSARAGDRTVFERTRDPRWAAWIAQAHSVDVEPPAPFGDLQLLEEVAWRGVAACRPIRYFYASRDSRAIAARTRADAAAFAAGQLDPGRFYIILSGPVPDAVRGRAVMLDGVWVVPPAVAAPPPTLCR